MEVKQQGKKPGCALTGAGNTTETETTEEGGRQSKSYCSGSNSNDISISFSSSYFYSNLSRRLAIGVIGFGGASLMAIVLASLVDTRWYVI